MTDAQQTSEMSHRWWSKRATLLCVVTILCAYFSTSRSYRFSDSLTFLDATICTDEGLLSLQIPLVLRSPIHQPSTQWITYVRGKNMWDAPGCGGKATLRYWMSILDQTRCEGAMWGGFGYWKGDWQSSSRPGPFVVAFAPIWIAIVVISIFLAMLWSRRLRIRLLTMFITTAAVALLLAVLNLCAAQ